MLLGTSPTAVKRFMRTAFTALIIGAAIGAVSALPLADVAYAKNGGGNGGGGGKGGGNGGGKGGGNGGGKSSDRGGGNSNGNGNGKSKSGAEDSDVSKSKSGKTESGDDSLSPSALGKLNGVLHASPQALANASPNSPIGMVGQVLRDALTSGATPEQLGGILAGATNKKVTGAQVQAVIDRLAEANPNDDALKDMSENPDEQRAQDIADAANDAKAGISDDAEGDDGTDGTDSGDGTTDQTGSEGDGTTVN